MPVTPEDQAALTQPYEIVDDNATGVCPHLSLCTSMSGLLKPADDPTRNPCWCSQPMAVGWPISPGRQGAFQVDYESLTLHVDACVLLKFAGSPRK